MQKSKNKIFFILLSLLLTPMTFGAEYGSYQLAPDVGEYKINKDYRYTYEVNRDEGYYINGQGQVPEYHRIPPPNPDKIPQYPHPAKTVLPFDKYYDTNIAGIRRSPDKTPLIPNYNIYYSNRRAYPYTKNEYIDVWCTGIKHEKGVDCQTQDYAITFVKAGEWPFGVIKAPFKARKVKKKSAIFIMIDDLGLDGPNINGAKNWSDLFNIPMFFGTIDSEIPKEWIN